MDQEVWRRRYGQHSTPQHWARYGPIRHTCRQRASRCSVYEIGLGRTGTRSVAEAARRLGVDALHGIGRCPGCKQDAYRRLLSGCCDLDVYRRCEYSGNVAYVHWKKIAESVPDSRFILTLRDIDEWLASHARRQSPHRWMLRMAQRGKWSYLAAARLCFYGQIQYDIKQFQKRFEEHTSQVFKYFDGAGRSNRLLVVNIFRQDVDHWQRLRDFLSPSVPVPDEPFPEIGRHVS